MTEVAAARTPAGAPASDPGAQAGGHVPGSADQAGGYVSGSATPAGGQVVETAAQAGGQVVDSVKQQGGAVAAEAGQQARQLAAEARRQLADQAQAQQQKAAGGLRSLGGELRAMADGASEPGTATDLVRQVSTHVEQAAQWLESRDPGALLDELRGYARRSPGTFLLGAALLGVAAGRLTRTVAADSGAGGTATGAASTPSGGYGGRHAEDATATLGDLHSGGLAGSGYGADVAAGPTGSGLAGGTADAGYPAGYPAGGADPAYPGGSGAAHLDDGAHGAGTTYGTARPGDGAIATGVAPAPRSDHRTV
ncbi:MAG TPA: hypothetical protein VFY17_08175 [Pilimelia sp.]|nr:hypothetical protein [Pilimelia sp.]